MLLGKSYKSDNFNVDHKIEIQNIFILIAKNILYGQCIRCSLTLDVEHKIMKIMTPKLINLLTTQHIHWLLLSVCIICC